VAKTIAPLEFVSHRRGENPQVFNPPKPAAPARRVRGFGKFRCGIIRPSANAQHSNPSNEAATRQSLVPYADGKYASDLQHQSGVPLIMRLRFEIALLLVTTSAVVGCQMTQPRVTQELVVGNYTFVSNDPESRATDHNLNHLVLKSDGTYDLVEGGTTKAVVEKKGAWRIEPGTPSDHVDVVLDHSGYPVEIKKNEVRLLISLDTGVWWVKPR